MATGKKAALSKSDLLTVTLMDAKKVLAYSIKADQPVNLIGPPGIGKSAIASAVAREMNMPLEVLILSLCDPTDIGGFPVTSASDGQGEISRLPLANIKRACEHPVILFLDELTCATPTVQGAALRLIYERWAGDAKLHPGTRIIAASNPADQAAGGWEQSLPLLGRLTQIKVMPTVGEVQDYLFNLGEHDSPVRAMAVDLAATLFMSPDLIQFDPPQASSVGLPWASPRSWERAIKVCSTALVDNVNDQGEVFHALMAGNVGEDQAMAYLAIRKVRDSLPSIEQIKKDPTDAKMPSNQDGAIAALGVIAQVAIQHPNAAWAYSARLTGEAKVAALNTVGKFKLQSKDPYYKEAQAAQKGLLKNMGQALTGKDTD
jgi:hypothetical protein